MNNPGNRLSAMPFAARAIIVLWVTALAVCYQVPVTAATISQDPTATDTADPSPSLTSPLPSQATDPAYPGPTETATVTLQVTSVAQSSVTATATAAVAPRSIPHEERPIVVVTGFETNPRPGSGAVFQLQLRLRNEGERFAENVKVTLSAENFLSVEGSATGYLNNLDEGSDGHIDFRLRAAAGLAGGVYPLAVALQWDDSYGQTYTDATSIGIEVVADGPVRPALAVVGSRVPSVVAAGVPFAVALDVENVGRVEARQVSLSTSGGSLAPVGTGAGAPITIAPGARATVTIRLVAGSTAERQAVSQPLEIRYDDPSGQRYTEDHVIGVILAGETPFGAVPIIVSYETRVSGRQGADDGVFTLHPGERFDLVLTVRNVGIQAAARTRLTLGSSSTTGSTTGSAASVSLGAFAPVGSGNVLFLDRLEPEETRTVVQPMVTNGAAAAGVHALPIEFSFVDGQGTAQASAEVISLLVGQRVDLRITPLSPVESAVTGMPVPFSVEIMNASAGSVRVGDVEIVGDDKIDVEEGVRFIGALDAGGADVIDATLVPTAVGRAVVTVRVNFQDDFNATNVVEETFAIDVTALPELGFDAPIEQPSDGGNIFVRFIRGLLGLGASPPVARSGPPELDAPSGRPAGRSEETVVEPVSAEEPEGAPSAP
jgi:hypothetical protein